MTRAERDVHQKEKCIVVTDLIDIVPSALDFKQSYRNSLVAFLSGTPQRGKRIVHSLFVSSTKKDLLVSESPVRPRAEKKWSK